MQKLIEYPLVAVIGNYDDAKLFNEYCGLKEFAFANRNSYFIILNNEEGLITDKQFDWLN